MLKVSLRVYSLDVESRDISWSIEPASETYSLYKMDLYRGETYQNAIASGQYALLVSGLNFTDMYSYTDSSISGMHTHGQRHFWYKAYIYNATTGEAEWTGEVTHEQVADLGGRKIWKYKNIGLRNKYGGIQFVALKRKTFGDTCAVCWDSYLQRRNIDYCAACFDTGISGGFYQPIPFQGMMTASPKRHQMMLWGEWRAGDAALFTSHHPHFETRDVVVDLNNRRWEVIQVRSVEKGMATLEQSLQIRRIPNDDILYRFSVSGYLTIPTTTFKIVGGEPI